METGVLHCVLPQGLRFLNFLRGMETGGYDAGVRVRALLPKLP